MTAMSSSTSGRSRSLVGVKQRGAGAPRVRRLQPSPPANPRKESLLGTGNDKEKDNEKDNEKEKHSQKETSLERQLQSAWDRWTSGGGIGSGGGGDHGGSDHGVSDGGGRRRSRSISSGGSPGKKQQPQNGGGVGGGVAGGVPGKVASPLAAGGSRATSRSPESPSPSKSHPRSPLPDGGRRRALYIGINYTESDRELRGELVEASAPWVLIVCFASSHYVSSFSHARYMFMYIMGNQ